MCIIGKYYSPILHIKKLRIRAYSSALGLLSQNAIDWALEQQEFTAYCCRLWDFHDQGVCRFGVR